MKTENLKTFIANLGVALIVLNIIVPIINIFLGEGEHPRFNSIITYLAISIILIISGIGLLKKKRWSINLYLISSVLLMIHYLVVYPLLYLIVIFFNPYMWGVLPILMLISSIYLFKKRKIINDLLDNGEHLAQIKNWDISKNKFVLLAILSNILSWIPFLSYFLYGIIVEVEAFSGIAGVIVLFYIDLSIVVALVINIALLQAYIKKNKKILYTTTAISIILALIYMIPLMKQYLTTGELY